MNKKISSEIAIGIILLVAIGVGVAIYFGDTGNISNKIYKNNLFNYEISYPSDFKVFIRGEECILGEVCFASKNITPNKVVVKDFDRSKDCVISMNSVKGNICKERKNMKIGANNLYVCNNDSNRLYYDTTEIKKYFVFSNNTENEICKKILIKMLETLKFF